MKCTIPKTFFASYSTILSSSKFGETRNIEQSLFKIIQIMQMEGQFKKGAQASNPFSRIIPKKKISIQFQIQHDNSFAYDKPMRVIWFLNSDFLNKFNRNKIYSFLVCNFHIAGLILKGKTVNRYNSDREDLINKRIFSLFPLLIIQSLGHRQSRHSCT